ALAGALGAAPLSGPGRGGPPAGLPRRGGGLLRGGPLRAPRPAPLLGGPPGRPRAAARRPGRAPLRPRARLRSPPPPGGAGGPGAGRQLHPRSARLGQPDRDRLLGRPRAVLALPDVPDLLVYELAGLRARRLALFGILLSALGDLLLRHGSPPLDGPGL